MRKPKETSQATSSTQVPDSVAQTTPRPVRSFDDMNTGHMVFELQGTVGEIKNAVKNLEKIVEKGFDRIESKMKEHQSAINSIHRIIWMVTGGAIVVGAIVGAVLGIGVANIGRILTGFGPHTPP